MLFALGMVGQTYTYDLNFVADQGNPGGVFTGGDATSGGTTLISGSAAGNSWSAPFAIPFSFNYFGNAVTHLKVSGNGVVTFDTSATVIPSDNNTNLPALNATGVPSNSIMGFWDAFTGSAPTGSNDAVYAQLYGTAPNQQLWIRYFSYEYGSTGTASVASFSYWAIVLEESTDKVYIVDMNYHNNGASLTTTIGLQEDTTNFVQVGSTNTVPMGAGSSGAADNDYYEFTPRIVVANDAGTVSIDAPNSPLTPGSQAVNATIINQGTSTLNSATVNWSVNGIVQTPFSYTGSLANGATASVTLGNYNFTGISNIEVWTSMPNGVADGNPSNDTIRATVYPGLSGTYTIDSTAATGGTNFNSFADFENAINQGGLLGPITVNVAAGTYNESLLLENVLGSSSTNTITIDGGDSSATILNSSAGFYGIAIVNMDYVTIQNLGLINTSTSAMNVIFGDSADYNTVQNCELIVSTSSTSSLVNNIGTSSSITSRSTNAFANYNTVNNNHMIGGYYGIYFYGGSSSIQTGNQANNNDLDSVYQYGLYSYYQDFVIMTGNDVDQTSRGSTSGDGFYGAYMSNFNISSNNLIAFDYGFYITNASTATPAFVQRSLISNNMIGSATDYGMYLYSVDSVDVFHNTIATDGTSSPAFQIGQSTSYRIGGYDVRNNIFASSNTEAFETTSAISDTVMSTFDYNVFYTLGTDLINISGTQYANLAAYQTASPTFNMNSHEGDPLFVSLTDLHIAGTIANDVGDNTVGILVDIDGDTRPQAPSTTVDIGADEYTPPACAFPGGLTATNISSDSADLAWMENGTATTWYLEWGPAGFTLGTGTTVTINTTPMYTLKGLNPATAYEYYVRSFCGAGDTSSWSTSFTFSTSIAGPRGVSCVTGNPTVIFSEEFDAQGGWTGDISTAAVAGDWNFGRSGATGSSNTGPSAAHSGSNYVFVEASGSAGSPWGTNAIMVSPAIDLTAVTDSAELSFWIHAYGQSMGTLDVGVSTSASGPFTSLFNYTGQIQSADTDPWVNVGARLDAYVGQVIYLQFDFLIGNNYFSDIGIDLLEVTSCASCSAPSNSMTSAITPTSAQFNWMENGLATQWEVEYDTTGFTLGTGNSMVVNTDTFLNVTTLTSQTAYDWYVRAICGPGDTSSWSLVETFLTPCPAISTFPVVENFENNLACWTQSNVSGTANWIATTANQNSSVTPLNGSNLGLFYSGNYNDDASYLISPALDLSGLTAPQLSFFYTQVDWSGDQDTLGVYYKTSASGSWTYLTSYNSSVSAWTQETILLPNASSDYYVAFLGYSGYGRGVTLDSIVVEEAPACIAPTMAMANVLSTDSAVLSWVENNSAMMWEISYGMTGFTAGNGTQYFTSSNPDTLSMLMANTSYDYYVRAICGAGDTSAWSAAVTFTTPCMTMSTFPYVENFENNLNCWTQSNVSGTASWVEATGNQNSSVTPLNGNGLALFYSANYNDDASYLISPALDLSGLSAPEMSFFYTQVDWSGDQDTLGVYYKTSATGTWTYLASYNSSVSAWTQVTLSLPNPSSDYYIGFLGYSGYGRGVTLDSLVIEDPVMAVCGVPTQLSASSITTSSAMLNWVDTNATMAPEYQYSYGPTGFTAGSGTEMVVTTNSAMVSSLMSNTSYDWYARSICAVGDTSMWSAVASFTTSLPYYPIGTINTEDANGDADSTNVECITSGIVVGFDRRGGNGYEVAIIDMSSGVQEGITLFDFNDVSSYTPATGDSIKVWGSVDQFRGLIQFRPDSISLISSNVSLPTPIVSNVLDETTESKLINMTEKFILLDPSTTGSFNAYAWRLSVPTDTILIRVDADSDIDDSLSISTNAWVVGDTICGLIGVGGQYDFNAPFLGDYQVFPNSWADISICRNTVGINENESNHSISIYPNPTNGQFTIKTSGLANANALVTVRDISGRVIFEENIAQSNQAFTKVYDLSNYAKGLYFINLMDGNNQQTFKLIVQ